MLVKLDETTYVNPDQVTKVSIVGDAVAVYLNESHHYFLFKPKYGRSSHQLLEEIAAKLNGDVE